MPVATTNNSSRYLAPLDGLRAVAILMVMVFHFSYSALPGGVFGVDLFFVLSGYLITWLLCEEFERNGRIGILFFYVRRALRLLPALLTLIVLVGLLWDYSGATPNVSRPFALLATMFYFMNFIRADFGMLEHTWSLCIEEHFYAFWPLLLAFLVLKKKGTTRVLIVAGLVVFFSLLRAACYLVNPLNMDAIFTMTPTRVDVILVGALAFFIADTYRETTQKVLRIWAKYYVIEISLILLPLIVCFTNAIDAWVYLGGFTLLAAYFACIVLRLTYADKNSLLQRFFGNPVFVWTGKRSYGIYLYHFPVYALSEHWRVADDVFNLLWVSFLRLLISLAIAEISYRSIEQPFLKLKASYRAK